MAPLGLPAEGAAGWAASALLVFVFCTDFHIKTLGKMIFYCD